MNLAIVILPICLFLCIHVLQDCICINPIKVGIILMLKNVKKIMPIYATHKDSVWCKDTLYTHWGDIQCKKSMLSMLDLVQRNLLLLLYFHEKYGENQQRVLMIADSGRHFFHWSSQTPNYLWILPSQISEWNATFQQTKCYHPESIKGHTFSWEHKK